MKKFLVLFGITFLMFGLAFNAHATSFDFLGSDEGGTASATVDFQVLGSTFKITINNTSPTSLIDGTLLANAPAITGVGFNVDPNMGVSSWSLTAYDIISETTINIDDDDGTNDWTLALYTKKLKLGNIKLDLYAESELGSQGGFYNPATLAAPVGTIPFGGPPRYFTEAVFTINFEAETSLVVEGNSPFTRWQNVGKDGEGSLKLTSIPDPTAVFLLGSACLLGFAGARRKFKK